MKEYIKPNCHIMEFEGDDVMNTLLIASGEIDSHEVGSKKMNFDDEDDDWDYWDY